MSGEKSPIDFEAIDKWMKEVEDAYFHTPESDSSEWGPAGTIGLADLFQMILLAKNPEVYDFQAEADDLTFEMDDGLPDRSAETNSAWDVHSIRMNQIDVIYSMNAQFLRSRLSSGELVAFVQCPETKEHTALPTQGWDCDPRIGAFISNFVGPGLRQTGPAEAVRDGKPLPVFFHSGDVEIFFFRNRLHKTVRGRPKGSGPNRAADHELAREMQALIDEGKAASPHAAAQAVVGRAKKTGTEQSAIRRLMMAHKRLCNNR